MASAYTPGLRVSCADNIKKLRRLPLAGEVVVKLGDTVRAEDVVAKTELPGIIQTVRASSELGIDESEIESKMVVNVGDKVNVGDILAATSSFFGLIKTQCRTKYAGTIDFVSSKTGNIGIRKPARPVEIKAYIDGTICEIIENEGVFVEANGAFLQGIFGVGKERCGILACLCENPDDILDADMIDDSCRGKIIVGASSITAEAVKRAVEVGVEGVITASITDKMLADYLGYDIGVAITGEEEIPFTLIVTEGFGMIPPSKRSFQLLKRLDGKKVSISGATQIRAGVIRPEIVCSQNVSCDTDETIDGDCELVVGARVRLIRQPYFGLLGTVAAMPQEPTAIQSGAVVRVCDVRLDEGEIVTVPRANIEMMF